MTETNDVPFENDDIDGDGPWVVVVNYQDLDSSLRQEVFGQFDSTDDAESWINNATDESGSKWVQSSAFDLPSDLPGVGVRAIKVDYVHSFGVISREHWDRIANDDSELEEARRHLDEYTQQHPEDTTPRPAPPRSSFRPDFPPGFVE